MSALSASTHGTTRPTMVAWTGPKIQNGTDEYAVQICGLDFLCPDPEKSERKPAPNILTTDGTRKNGPLIVGPGYHCNGIVCRKSGLDRK